MPFNKAAAIKQSSNNECTVVEFVLSYEDYDGMQDKETFTEFGTLFIFLDNLTNTTTTMLR